MGSSVRPFICAANWKMNKTPKEAASFMKELSLSWPEDTDKEVIVFPPSLCWREVRDGVRDLPVTWGLQNAYPEKSGAFTGELSMSMLAEIGGQNVLVGHSERRSYFHEGAEFLAAKVKAAQEEKLVPMLCVGETLDEREAGETNQVITQQLEEGLASVDGSRVFHIAYEPVWAIGTGQVATAEIAQEAHAVLRGKLQKLFGKEVAEKTALLYGGSVKAKNASELSRRPDIDGFLIGGASLNPSDFLEIIKVS